MGSQASPRPPRQCYALASAPEPALRRCGRFAARYRRRQARQAPQPGAHDYATAKRVASSAARSGVLAKSATTACATRSVSGALSSARM